MPKVVTQVTARFPSMEKSEKLSFKPGQGGYNYLSVGNEDQHAMGLKPFYPKPSKKTKRNTLHGTIEQDEENQDDFKFNNQMLVNHEE